MCCLVVHFVCCSGGRARERDASTRRAATILCGASRRDVPHPKLGGPDQVHERTPKGNIWIPETGVQTRGFRAHVVLVVGRRASRGHHLMRDVAARRPAPQVGGARPSSLANPYGNKYGFLKRNIKLVGFVRMCCFGGRASRGHNLMRVPSNGFGRAAWRVV